MRARQADREDYVERDGVRLFYEVFGEGDRTVFFLPTWSIIHSRHWKAQIHYFARHLRVLTFDGRGNGRSDRPSDPAAYAEHEFVADALAIMDAMGTERAALVSLSAGAQWALLLAAEHPDRVTAAAFIGPALPWPRRTPSRPFTRSPSRLRRRRAGPRTTSISGGRTTARSWSSSSCAPSPSRTRPSRPRTALAGAWRRTRRYSSPLSRHARWTRTPRRTSRAASRAPCWSCTATRTPSARTPAEPPWPRWPLAGWSRSRARAATWVRGKRRRKRALFISSPIGLGHAQRDAAIADELRTLHPDLEIDWLVQHPVTEVLKRRGERVHPASAHLSSEAAHIDAESAEHDLHCFQAWRRMDEILVANFMVFHDLVRDEPYDLWIGDEAWELDYYLHENPELKTAAYAWLTDFVGWLPMPDGGEREAYLAADYNAEMIEHIARYPRVRDRAIFVGSPEDIVPEPFGRGLPCIREWTEAHYDFSGYVTGFDPAALADRAAIREQLGYRPDERVCIVTVGGSGVGGHLLRRVIAAFPEAKRQVPDLRMVVVAGPRIDPESLPKAAGLEVRPYVHELYRHLAVCDLAVVQGGLTTTMELVANRRPFLYFPLRRHFEQNFHVRHRLERHRAGRCMDFATSTPEVIADAMAQEIGRPVPHYRPVETDGAARAAARIAELL